MPFHRIYSVPGTFSDEDMKTLAKKITELYVKNYGLPPFYVVVLFIDVEEKKFFVGGETNKEKMVRLVLDHGARALAWNIEIVRFFKAYEAVLAPYIKNRGRDWEIHITAGDVNLWRENDVIPPVPGSAAEKEWVRLNKPVPYTEEQNQ